MSEILALSPQVVDSQQQESTETSLVTIIKDGLKLILKKTKRLGLKREVIQTTQMITDIKAVPVAMDLDDEPELEPAFTTLNTLHLLTHVRHRPRRHFVKSLEEQLQEEELEVLESSRAVEINKKGQEIPLRPAPRPRPQFRPEPRANAQSLELRPEARLIPAQPTFTLGIHLLAIMVDKSSNLAHVMSLTMVAQANSPAEALEALVPALALAFEASRLMMQQIALAAENSNALLRSQPVMQAQRFTPNTFENNRLIPHLRLLDGTDNSISVPSWDDYRAFEEEAYNPQGFFASNPRPALELPRNEQRLSALGFSTDLVPEKYKCLMMGSVMDNPVSLPHSTEDKFEATGILEHLHRHRNDPKNQNPYARGPLNEDQLKPDIDLRREIGGYIDNIEKGVNQKRRELGRNALSEDDYKSINQAVLSRMPQNQASQESAPKLKI